jgi:hypothetical protein
MFVFVFTIMVASISYSFCCFFYQEKDLILEVEMVDMKKRDSEGMLIGCTSLKIHVLLSLFCLKDLEFSLNVTGFHRFGKGRLMYLRTKKVCE